MMSKLINNLVITLVIVKSKSPKLTIWRNKDEAIIVGRTSVKLSREEDTLVVEINGIKEISRSSGIFRFKAGTSLSYQVIDGKEVAVIEYPPEVHRYKKVRAAKK